MLMVAKNKYFMLLKYFLPKNSTNDVVIAVSCEISGLWYIRLRLEYINLMTPHIQTQNDHDTK